MQSSHARPSGWNGRQVQVFRVRAVSTRFQPFRAISIALSGPNRDIYSGESRGWAGCRRGVGKEGASGGGVVSSSKTGAPTGVNTGPGVGFGTPEVLLRVREVVSTRLLRVLRGGLWPGECRLTRLLLFGIRCGSSLAFFLIPVPCPVRKTGGVGSLISESHLLRVICISDFS